MIYQPLNDLFTSSNLTNIKHLNLGGHHSYEIDDLINAHLPNLTELLSIQNIYDGSLGKASYFPNLTDLDLTIERGSCRDADGNPVNISDSVIEGLTLSWKEASKVGQLNIASLNIDTPYNEMPTINRMQDLINIAKKGSINNIQVECDYDSEEDLVKDFRSTKEYITLKNVAENNKQLQKQLVSIIKDNFIISENAFPEFDDKGVISSLQLYQNLGKILLTKLLVENEIIESDSEKATIETQYKDITKKIKKFIIDNYFNLTGVCKDFPSYDGLPFELKEKIFEDLKIRDVKHNYNDITMETKDYNIENDNGNISAIEDVSVSGEGCIASSLSYMIG